MITSPNQYVLSNFAETTLSQALATGATSMVVVDAGDFPVLSAGQVFRVTLYDGTQDPEIVEVSATSGTTWTISRGKESTVDSAWEAGTKVRIAVTAETLASLAALPRYGIQWYKKTISDDVTVGSGFGAFVVNPTFSGDLTIDSGGTLGAIGDVTVSGTLTVNGELIVAGGKYSP